MKYPNRLLFAVSLLLSVRSIASAQSLDGLNLQFHGYVTQGFVYTTHNNWNTTASSDGSAAFTEAVINLSASPDSRLRIGIQARYSLLGNLGNSITLDWAQADYKFNDRIGVRAGKVKTPTGLFNESQDVDPTQLWILLPQSIYPLASRNSVLAHFGGVVYGTLPLGESFGKLEYRAFGGVRQVASDDGYLQPFRDAGLSAPNGISDPLTGGTLHWDTPVHGLMLGATESYLYAKGDITVGPYQGSLSTPKIFWPYLFGQYERNKLMLAGEYSRLAADVAIQLTGLPTTNEPRDVRSFYVMAGYKLTGKLSGGAYYSSSLDRLAPFTSARFQKDWTLSSRYDFNPFLYVKVEQHFIDGTEIGFSSSDNSVLKPNTRMTLLKLGTTF